MPVAGAVLLSAGLALTPLASTEWSLILILGMLTAAGAGAGSFSILIGAAVRQIPQGYGALAGGFINAGSFGQFVFAPLLQAMISTWGWVTAITATAVTALLTILLPPYLWMWYGDIALAAAAAMVNLLIHEPGPEEKSYFENAR